MLTAKKEEKKQMTNGARIIEMMIIVEELEKINEWFVDTLDKITNDGELVEMGKEINNLTRIITSFKINLKVAVKYITITEQDIENFDSRKTRICEIVTSNDYESIIIRLAVNLWNNYNKEINKELINCLKSIDETA